MTETWKQRLFREPEGISSGLFWISFAIVCFGVYRYDDGLTEAGSVLSLIFGVLFVLISIPELFPSEYRYAAGVWRMVTVLFAVLSILYFGVVF